MTRHLIPALLLAFAVACGGGSSTPTETTGAPQTAQEIVQSCFSGELADLSGLLGMLQGLLDENATPPEIRVGWLEGLLGGGTFPWSIDLDQDEVADLTGTLHFTDSNDAITLPFDLQNLPDLADPDLEAILGAIADGTTVHLHFGFDELLFESGSAASGDGDLEFLIENGTVAATSGTGTFDSFPCTLDFDYEVDDVSLLEPGDWPVAEIGFELESRGSTMSGTATLDGSDTAVVRAALPGEPEETFEIDLTPASEG